LSDIDYAGQPAGYASQPDEVVNYVENHDNQTLFDNHAMKMPRGTSHEDRARAQVLAGAITAFSQGVAYFHAGIDLLRSKSLDRNSFNSGDWFNRIDWSGRTNHFGTGLPPQEDNGKDWPLMRPLLADAGMAPTPADIAWTREAFRDLLRIRASSPLFRLASSDEVRQRLHFLNTGPQQEPTVLVGHLDGRGGADAGFDELVYLINVDRQPHAITLDALKGRPWQLHPVQGRAEAAESRAALAQVDPATGRFQLPPRAAVVFVVARP
jgi:pullulanase/glycogen debranching enzyme